MKDEHALYTPTFILGFTYNFIIALHFTNNALYPIYVQSEGGGIALVGLFMGVYSAAAVAGRPIIGLLIDRCGAGSVLVTGCLCLSLPAFCFAGMLGAGLGPAAWALRSVQGFGYGAHFSATFTLAVKISPAGRRNEAIAMYGVSGLAGAMVGPIIGEMVVNGLGLQVFFIAMGFIGITAALIVSRIRVGRPDAKAPSPRAVLSAMRAPGLRFAALLALLLAVCYSSPQSFLATIAESRGIRDFSLYFTAWGFGGIIIRIVGGRWGDRYGLRRVLLPGFSLYAAGLVLLAVSHTTAGVIAAGFLCGIAHGISFPAVTALGFALAPEEMTGSAMALVTGMMDAGAAIMSLAVGRAAEAAGFGIIFPLAAAAALTAAIVLYTDIRKNPTAIRSSSGSPS